MKRLSDTVALLGGGPTFFCPGCRRIHRVLVAGCEDAGPIWEWNANPQSLTINPSILVTGVEDLTDEQHEAFFRGEPLPEPIPLTCHSFVRDGKIQFLSDCTHQLAGQTVPIPPLPEWCK